MIYLDGTTFRSVIIPFSIAPVKGLSFVKVVFFQNKINQWRREDELYGRLHEVITFGSCQSTSLMGLSLGLID